MRHVSGGLYYIISRSLGPEFGASVGVVFAFANSVSASMNTIGFCNSLNDLLQSYDLKIVDGDVNDVRIVGTIAILVMVFICALGMDWEAKAQNFLIAVILIAMFDFMLGTIIGPLSVDQVAKGFTGFKCMCCVEICSSTIFCKSILQMKPLPPIGDRTTVPSKVLCTISFRFSPYSFHR